MQLMKQQQTSGCINTTAILLPVIMEHHDLLLSEDKKKNMMLIQMVCILADAVKPLLDMSSPRQPKRMDILFSQIMGDSKGVERLM